MIPWNRCPSMIYCVRGGSAFKQKQAITAKCLTEREEHWAVGKPDSCLPLPAAQLTSQPPSTHPPLSLLVSNLSPMSVVCISEMIFASFLFCLTECYHPF